MKNIKTFEDFVNEQEFNSLSEASIIVDAMDPTDSRLLSTVKKLGLGMNILTWKSPSGYPEVEFKGDKKKIEKLLDLHFDGAENFEDMIEESLNENKGSKAVILKLLNKYVEHAPEITANAIAKHFKRPDMYEDIIDLLTNDEFEDFDSAAMAISNIL